ncbi:MAG: hypothetical protein JNL86_03680 [Nitrospira sp.]|nr:hypothetical protein [Nitrospira sp.]MBX3336807.1 hypothetical protein [Nitrospira sp.]MCC7471653.1 hypothetical protein [Candidatus Nomurabacteria bacterium]
MKIRKKIPKPAPAKLPLYVVGYRGIPPSLDELTIWYDLQYGGPLVWTDRHADGRASATHGPWRAHVLTSLPETDAAQWQSVLTWDHQQLGVVSPSATTPGTSTDTVLVAARLARGLTLLTDGTAFDVTCHEYLNPSDWNDRPLTVFVTGDHVTVQHKEADDQRSEWFYTLGLTKFGLDELEMIQPRGLPEADAIKLLESAADEVLRTGRNHTVGSSLDLFAIARTIHVIKHRTAAPTGRTVAFRQIATAPR